MRFEIFVSLAAALSAAALPHGRRHHIRLDEAGVYGNARVRLSSRQIGGHVDGHIPSRHHANVERKPYREADWKRQSSLRRRSVDADGVVSVTLTASAAGAYPTEDCGCEDHQSTSSAIDATASAALGLTSEVIGVLSGLGVDISLLLEALLSLLNGSGAVSADIVSSILGSCGAVPQLVDALTTVLANPACTVQEVISVIVITVDGIIGGTHAVAAGTVSPSEAATVASVTAAAGATSIPVHGHPWGHLPLKPHHVHAPSAINPHSGAGATGIAASAVVSATGIAYPDSAPALGNGAAGILASADAGVDALPTGTLGQSAPADIDGEGTTPDAALAITADASASLTAAGVAATAGAKAGAAVATSGTLAVAASVSAAADVPSYVSASLAATATVVVAPATATEMPAGQTGDDEDGDCTEEGDHDELLDALAQRDIKTDAHANGTVLVKAHRRRHLVFGLESF